MKTRAAVIYEKYTDTAPLREKKPLVVEELDLDDPREGEVLVKIVGAGICHSDHHSIDGMYTINYPMVLGHEAGVKVVKVGKGCKKVKEGDHAIASWMPACRRCRYCVSGMSWMCDQNANTMTGMLPDNTHRLHLKGKPIGQVHFLGAFSEYAVLLEDSITVIDKDLPLDKVGICGCAIPTGFGAATNSAKVRVGSSCMVIGCGGVGTAAVQGCRAAGANMIIAVDHNDSRLELMKQFGATHTFNNEKEDVLAAVKDLTHGHGVDYAFEAIATPETQNLCVASIRKMGVATFIGLMWDSHVTINFSPFELVLYGKTIKGTLYGDSNIEYEIPKLMNLYKSGQLMLDEMVTNYYGLDQINEAFDDMLEGKNIRGMITFE